MNKIDVSAYRCGTFINLQVSLKIDNYAPCAMHIQDGIHTLEYVHRSIAKLSYLYTKIK